MSRVTRIVALVLLAIWLPVTMHCRLESAGLIKSHDKCSCPLGTATESDCRDDLCSTVENDLFNDAPAALTLSAPQVCDCTLLLTAFAVSYSKDPEPILCHARHYPPPELAVGWQFLSRAALLPGAPSLNA